MRSLLLPIGLSGLGILLALPFRRQQAVTQSVTAKSDVPDTVTPLNETLSTGTDSSEDVAELPEFRRPTQEAARSPFELPEEDIPTSYDEVAIPLILSGRLESNLLNHHPNPNATAAKRTRFGIPLDAYAAKRPAVNEYGWSGPRPLLPADTARAEEIASNTAKPPSAAERNPLQTASMSASQQQPASDPEALIPDAQAQGTMAQGRGQTPSVIRDPAMKEHHSAPILDSVEVGRRTGGQTPVRQLGGKQPEFKGSGQVGDRPRANLLDLKANDESGALAGRRQEKSNRPRHFIREPGT